jgi:hypothetical protein
MSGQADPDFRPNDAGHIVKLVDGSCGRIRFKRQSRHGQDEWAPELRVPNRDVPIPEGKNYHDMTKKVLQYFDKANTTIPFSETARLTFKGLSVCFNAKCATARNNGEEVLAARLGTAPWHLAMLATGLFLLELAVGEYDVSPKMADRSLEVDAAHVVRAFDLLGIVHEQERRFEKGIEAVWDAGDAGRRERLDMMAAVSTELLPFSQCPTWVPPGQGPARVPVKKEKSEEPGPADDAGNGLGPEGDQEDAEEDVQKACDHDLADADASAADDEQPEGDRGPLGVASPVPRHRTVAPPLAAAVADSIWLAPGDEGVPDIQSGYGPGGVSIQDPADGLAWLSDREIMRKTLQRGEVVFCQRRVRQYCQKIRWKAQSQP